MRAEELVHPTPAGLYCPPGDFYIDPVRPVERALVTHGHSDHARPGHQAVLATGHTLEIMALRYGPGFSRSVQIAKFGVPVEMDGVSATFFPAGHILGSAQIRLEYRGLSITVSGDYKRGTDPTAEPFELAPCEIFVTEATFGLPVFRHPDPASEIAKLLRSVAEFPDRTHLVGVYALGKAQRIIRLLRDNDWSRPLFIHGSLRQLCDYYEAAGIHLGDLRPATVDHAEGLAGEIVLGPPSAFNSPWVRRFADPVLGFASGWMGVRQRARQRGIELPLVLSDHCDWDELLTTIRDTGAREIWVTHGREEALVRWCEMNRIAARPLSLIGYEDETE